MFYQCACMHTLQRYKRKRHEAIKTLANCCYIILCIKFRIKKWESAQNMLVSVLGLLDAFLSVPRPSGCLSVMLADRQTDLR